MFKAHILLYHSTLGLMVIKKKKGAGLVAAPRNQLISDLLASDIHSIGPYGRTFLGT